MDRSPVVHLILGLLALFLASAAAFAQEDAAAKLVPRPGRRVSRHRPCRVHAGPVETPRRGHDHLCRPFDLCDRDAGRRADRHRLQRPLRCKSAAARCHDEQGAPHALHRRPGSQGSNTSCAAGIRMADRPDMRSWSTMSSSATCRPTSAAAARWRPTATPSSSSRSRASASAISAICTIGWRMPTTPPIGRLDIVMVPIDGGMTQSLANMREITDRLHSSIVLPMHRHSTPIGEFTSMMGEEFEVDFRSSRSLLGDFARPAAPADDHRAGRCMTRPAA